MGILLVPFMCELFVLMFLLRNLLAVIFVVPTVLIHMYKTLNSLSGLSKTSFNYKQNKASISVCLTTHHNVKIILDSSVASSMLLRHQILLSQDNLLQSLQRFSTLWLGVYNGIYF